MAGYLQNPNFEEKLGNHLAFTKALPLQAMVEVTPGLSSFAKLILFLSELGVCEVWTACFPILL